jgi:hypothetical protein
MVSITARDRQDVVSTLDLKWSGRHVASEDSEAEGSAVAVADLTEEEVAEVFTEAVEEVMVGDRQ